MNICAIQVSNLNTETPQCMTNDGLACEFPFEYNGVIYTGCTTEDEPDLWCSYTYDYDSDKQWNWCNMSTCWNTTGGLYLRIRFILQTHIDLQ